VVETLELLDGVQSGWAMAEPLSLRPALEGHESVPGVPEALHALASV
jgi:hypothetical protein